MTDGLPRRPVTGDREPISHPPRVTGPPAGATGATPPPDSRMGASPGRPTLGIGMIGYSFMGLAHSQAWRNARSFFDPALAAGSRRHRWAQRDAAGDAAHRFGWQHVETDWRRSLESDDVDVIDICTPGDTHAEITIAALEAGKHVLCEKPLANSVEEAEAMAYAAERAAAHGIRSMVGFTYRRVPAIALARQLVPEGRIGRVRHVRAQYLQDWLTDPQSPHDLADAEGARRLGCPGRHRRPHRRPRPARDGRAPHRGSARLTETFVSSAPCAVTVSAEVTPVRQ